MFLYYFSCTVNDGKNTFKTKKYRITPKYVLKKVIIALAVIANV